MKKLLLDNINDILAITGTLFTFIGITITFGIGISFMILGLWFIYLSIPKKRG